MDELLIMKSDEFRGFVAELTRELRQLRSDFDALRKREESLRLYSVKEAAALLKMHRNTIRNLVKRGELAPSYLNRKRGIYKISELSIRAFLTGKSNPKP